MRGIGIGKISIPVTFRRAYDALVRTHGERADVEYLRILHLAATAGEARVVEVLAVVLDQVGGFDHLMMMQQAGHLDHKRTVRSMTLFAKEVYPRIRDLPSTVASKVKAEPALAK